MLTIDKTAKKPNKRQAFEIIERAKLNAGMSDLDLDRLLLYFAPSAGKNPQTVEAWVALAVAKKDPRRPYLQYIYVEDGVASATDGQRAHRGKTDLPDGYYCPKTLARVEGVDWRYPDVDRIMPHEKEPVDTVDALVSDMREGVNGEKLYYLIIEPTGVAFDREYVAAARAAKVSISAKLGTLWGRSEFGKFVISQVRV